MGTGGHHSATSCTRPAPQGSRRRLAATPQAHLRSEPPQSVAPSLPPLASGFRHPAPHPPSRRAPCEENQLISGSTTLAGAVQAPPSTVRRDHCPRLTDEVSRGPQRGPQARGTLPGPCPAPSVGSPPKPFVSTLAHFGQRQAHPLWRPGPQKCHQDPVSQGSHTPRGRVAASHTDRETEPSSRRPRGRPCPDRGQHGPPSPLPCGSACDGQAETHADARQPPAHTPSARGPGRAHSLSLHRHRPRSSPLLRLSGRCEGNCPPACESRAQAQHRWDPRDGHTRPRAAGRPGGVPHGDDAVGRPPC